MKPGSVRAFLATLVLGLVAIGAMASSAFALSPAVATQPASSLAETGATLNGLVNPNGSETKIYFEYGTTTSYGSKTAEVSAGSGSATVEKNQGISGLNKNTLYHYRIVASNSFGSSQGIDRTFTTTGPPEVSSPSAEPHGSGEGATLKAWVDPNGQSTTYRFEYGTKAGSYPNVTPTESAGSETSGKYVTYTVTGLMPGTKYYWRVTASNAGGKVDGSETTFMSSNTPGIEDLPPVEVLSKEATLRANIDTNAATAKYYFEYGTTTSYGTKVPVSPKEIAKPEEGEVVSVSEVASGLKPKTLYHYRVVAENSFGTTKGTDQTFTTQSLVTLRYKGGEALKIGAPLKAFSSNLTFSTGEASRKCAETEFSGEISENPGAVQSVTSTKMQNIGGAGCLYYYFYKIKYSIPTEGVDLWYTTNGSEGIARLSEVTLVGSFYWENFLVGECKYNLDLSGPYELGTPIESMTLSGTTEFVEGTWETCPSAAESVSGDFTVTSGGVAVEGE